MTAVLEIRPRGEGSPSAFEPEAFLNVADHIRRIAEEMPYGRAIVIPGPRDATGRRAYHQHTFAELDRAIDRWARGLAALGVNKGMRVLFMVRPSFEFFGLTFALFRMGAVPVMIDPGMGKDRVLGAIREVEAEAFIGIPKAHLARVLYPRAFESVRIAVTIGRRWLWRGANLETLDHLGEVELPADPLVAAPPEHPSRTFAPTRARDAAAILFTSGSTGAPKGVLYTHAIFDEQVRIFREELHIGAGEVDLSAFPLFSLFSAALGVTCVVPDMDATRPAAVDPALIVESIRDLGVTYSFGSPAFWKRVAHHCRAHDIELSSIRRVLMAGAPAPVSLLEQLVRIVPEGADVFTPYGATECLPISMPSARALLAGATKETESGAGTCVGKPLARTKVAIIRITDEPIAEMKDVELLAPRQIGEILVSGPVTTEGYFRRPLDDTRSKIKDGSAIWHRMGDVGYLDESGLLWFCGRKSHRVETEDGPMFTECCEAIFNRHPDVLRSALVGVGVRGKQRPVILIETKDSVPGSRLEELKRELLRVAESSSLTSSIRDVLFHPSFPVDPRHNAKIIREELAVWAAPRL